MSDNANVSASQEVKKESFLKRKGVEISVQKYLIDAMGSMAMGLMASLIAGLIIKMIGERIGLGAAVEAVYSVATEMTGAAIGVSIAHALGAPPLVLYAATIAGAAGNALGGPVGAYIAAIFGIELGKIVSKETPLDVVVTPAVTMISGVLVGTFIGPGISAFMLGLGKAIMYATTLRPFPMGIIVSVLFGLALTFPISSTALGIMLELGGLAAGASIAGTSAHMIGFAAISYRDNGMKGVLPVGLGTSMLHIANIFKNWKILIPPTIAAAITGPMATVIFKITGDYLGSGSGTSAFMGQFATIKAMEEAGRGGPKLYLVILLLHFVAPAVISWITYEIMRKRGWIKDGDLKLDL